MPCLQVNVTVLPLSLKPSVSVFCSVSGISFPLLVEEGYLFVEDKGGTYFLCVNKEDKR